MDDGKLVFRGPTDGTGKLVFGVVDEGGGVAPVSVQLDADLGGLDGDISVAIVTRAMLDADLGGLDGDIGALWDAGVVRDWRSEQITHWQEADRAGAGQRHHWGESVQLRNGVSTHYQEAVPAGHSVTSHWQEEERLRVDVRSRFQLAHPIANAQVQRWQEEVRMHAVVASRYQLAHPIANAQMQHWQEELRLMASSTHHWQEAEQRSQHFKAVWFEARPIHNHLQQHWQEATWPRAGISLPPKPPIKTPCYDPATLGRLIFEEAWTDDGKLVFVCYRKDGNPDPGTIVVPVQRTYIVLNSIELHRVSDGLEIPAKAFSMSLDVNSWTWTWQASIPGRALSLVQGVDGDAVEVEARVNDVPYRLIVEGHPRERSFASDWISVSGRGRSALLDQPDVPIINHGNAIAMSAQQLALQVLTLNGVSIGWDIEWGLTDWQVAANAWTLQGNYIAALSDMASAVGGYLQPHNTAQTIRMLPRYPKQPWLWSTIAPDYELPVDVVAVEGTDWVRNPAYNRVYISGEAAGFFSAKRGGTPGDFCSPMVTHPLLAHIEAARQRGIAELSAAGRSQSVTLSLQVLPQTGVIRPGKFVRYVDGGLERLGLVRSTNVSWEGNAKLRQRISLEVPEVA